MASPTSEMSFSSGCAEPSSVQGSPRSDFQPLDRMDCDGIGDDMGDDMGDSYMPDTLPSDDTSHFEQMNLESIGGSYMEVMRRLEEAQAEVVRYEMEVRASTEHLKMVLAESGLDHSDMEMNYDLLLGPGYYGLSSRADELDEIRFVDAELSDVPPLLEPSECLGGIDDISSCPEDATSKGKGREVDNETGKENKEGRTNGKAKGKARDKGKGKARASPYPDLRERLHLRTAMLGLGLPPLFPSYLTNAGDCTDDAMPDLLTGLRTRSFPFPADHFSGDPSGCGVPHHDDD